NLRFNAVPLREVLVQIGDWQGVNIWVNERAMEEESVDLNSSVTIKLNGVSVRSALKTILDKVRLTCVLRDDGVLEVTVPAPRHPAAAPGRGPRHFPPPGRCASCWRSRRRRPTPGRR